MSYDITAAWVEFIDGWYRRYGHEPVTLAQVVALPGSQHWMQNSGTRQELGATLTHNARLRPAMHPVRLRGRYAYHTKAGRVRKPAIWRLVTVQQEMAGCARARQRTTAAHPAETAAWIG